MTRDLITWDASKWTSPRPRLADSAGRRVPRIAHAPMSRSLGLGNMLLLHVPRADWNVRVGNVPQTISADTALTLVKAAASARPALPLDVNVQFMTMMATKMPFVARGSMPHAATDDGALLCHEESGKGTSTIAPP